MLGKRKRTRGATYRDKRESNRGRNCRSGKKSKKQDGGNGPSVCTGSTPLPHPRDRGPPMIKYSRNNIDVTSFYTWTLNVSTFSFISNAFYGQHLSQEMYCQIMFYTINTSRVIHVKFYILLQKRQESGNVPHRRQRRPEAGVAQHEISPV